MQAFGAGDCQLRSGYVLRSWILAQVCCYGKFTTAAFTCAIDAEKPGFAAKPGFSTPTGQHRQHRPWLARRPRAPPRQAHTAGGAPPAADPLLVGAHGRQHLPRRKARGLHQQPQPFQQINHTGRARSHSAGQPRPAASSPPGRCSPLPRGAPGSRTGFVGMAKGVAQVQRHAPAC